MRDAPPARGPMAATIALTDYMEYLKLKAWAVELENRRLRRRLGHV